ncbi:MAG: DUF1697 domain-containing protein [Sphingobacteriales bacterium]|nr:MAG: DUF1697 domain-containing protein [Sphingobacteriales bacterium]
MAKYIAFLRAINVGGSKIIKMEDLRRMIAAPGIKNIVTYIQSGNVVFEAKEADSAAISKKLEKHLEQQLGYKVEIMVRSVAEMQSVLERYPFKGKEQEGTMQYVSFLSEQPETSRAEELLSFNSEIDTFVVDGPELYTSVVKNGAKSRFEPAFIERKLKVLSTTRNMKTVNKMLELATAQ